MAYQQLPITPYEPQQVDPIGIYARLQAIKGAQQENQLREQQVVGAGQENQLRAEQMQDKQAIDNAYHDALTVDEQGNPKIDTAKLSNALSQSGHGSAVPGILEGIQKYQKSATDLQEAKGKVQAQAQEAMGYLGSAIQQSKYDPNLADMLIEQRLRSPNASPQELQQLQQMRSAIQQNPEMIRTLADSYVAQAPKQQEMQNARTVAGIRANGVDKIEMNDWLSKNPGKTPADYQQFKVDQGVTATVAKETNPEVLKARKDLAVSTAQAEAPTKIATAAAEANARMNIEGRAKTVYAFDKETQQTVPVSQTEALADPKRYSLVRPVTEKQIDDDRQLNNRLADVAIKIKRYSDASQKELSAGDYYAVSKILADDKFKLGIAHSEIPVDFLNQLDKAGYLNNLSPEAYKRFAAYVNAREAMQGYTRVLTGSGRSNEKAMQLNLDALPNPLMKRDNVNESIGQFNENVRTAAQGIPDFSKMGIKSPREVLDSMQQAGGKTLTRAQLQKAASDNGVSEAEAERQAKAKGYSITD